MVSNLLSFCGGYEGLGENQNDSDGLNHLYPISNPKLLKPA